MVGERINLVEGATTILRKNHLGMGQTKCYLAGYS